MNHEFTWDRDGFRLDGRPFRILSGEMHYFRIVPQCSRDRLRKARAMGLNAVCTYLCWNLHEPQPGVFDFAGMLDVAAFVRAAAEEGLLVLLRPGPYICSEWDFGGLPAWLLADPDARVRCMDERYLAAARRFVDRVGQELAGLTCTRGGPIIAVQVENEYGYYGNDQGYLAWLRDALRSAGFDVPLYTSDGPSARCLRAGTLDDLLAVINFAKEPERAMATFRKARPDGPAMCGEYWVGWFDHWGSPHKQGDDGGDCAAKMATLLDAGWSVNLYMLHGGTNFGFTAGANHADGYQADVTSYDYDAPLDEAGRPTPKYFALRDVIANHLSPDQLAARPALPPPTPIISFPPFELTESAPLFDHLPAPVRSPQPRPMETFGQSAGFILYRTRLDGLGDGKLTIAEPRDYAQVFLNGRRVAVLDRRKNEHSTALSVPPGEVTLDILVEAMGRVNFGPRLIDHKGITRRVCLDELTLMDWQVFSPLPMTDLSGLKFSGADAAGPAFHRGRFRLTQVGDAFLDLRAWTKGVVWVNGHNLGRYWNIGPQQTLYVPAPWLKPGDNEVIVFEQLADGRHSKPLAGLPEPILDQVRLW